jgi:hypothetical protein
MFPGASPPPNDSRNRAAAKNSRYQNPRRRPLRVTAWLSGGHLRQLIVSFILPSLANAEFR